ncbi:alpha/beta hydrolase [bacterium]|nr:alpha/beta hydrolase [bacterium]
MTMTGSTVHGHKTAMRWWMQCACAAVALYALVFLLAGCGPNLLIFQPPRSSYAEGANIIKVATADGNVLAAVHYPCSNATYTLLYSHGNGEDIGWLDTLFKWYNELGFSVFAYDYRGYGLSTGTPDEEECYADADAVFAYVTNVCRVPPERIIVHGRSLGGAMAVHLAATQPVAGLIMESTFLTAFRVVTRVPLVPDVMDRFRSMDRIPSVRCPVLVIHGLDDWVISPWHGEKLYELAPGPKMSLWVANAGHNDVVKVAREDYGNVMKEFAGLVAAQQAAEGTPDATSAQARASFPGR